MFGPDLEPGEFFKNTFDLDTTYFFQSIARITELHVFWFWSHQKNDFEMKSIEPETKQPVFQIYAYNVCCLFGCF